MLNWQSVTYWATQNRFIATKDFIENTFYNVVKFDIFEKGHMAIWQHTATWLSDLRKTDPLIAMPQSWNRRQTDLLFSANQKIKASNKGLCRVFPFAEPRNTAATPCACVSSKLPIVQNNSINPVWRFEPIRADFPLIFLFIIAIAKICRRKIHHIELKLL